MSIESSIGRLVFDVFDSVKSQVGIVIVEKTAGWNIEKSDLQTLLNEVNSVVDKNTTRASDAILNEVGKLETSGSKKTKGRRK